MTARKYQQRGYQEDGERDLRTPGRPRDRSEGPRGRGLGAPTSSVFKCSRCGASLTEGVSPGAVCTRCGSDLHTCTNCRHFDAAAPLECRKPIEKRITAKAKDNECELFESKMVQEFASESEPTAASAKSAFDDLFDF